MYFLTVTIEKSWNPKPISSDPGKTPVTLKPRFQGDPTALKKNAKHRGKRHGNATAVRMLCL